MASFTQKMAVLASQPAGIRLHRPGGVCAACGGRWPFIGIPVISDALADEWRLDQTWRERFNAREGRLCGRCQNSLRTQWLAEALKQAAEDQWGIRARCVADLVRVRSFQGLAVAELNSCGALHRILRRLPALCYSEFGSVSPSVPSEDLCDLSYPDAAFDLVLTSDTLEHVPDLEGALSEIRRVLRPEGLHVFTAPVVDDGRKSRRRARLVEGRVLHDLPPSYHGRPGQKAEDFLVYYEFGSDFVDLVDELGFHTRRIVSPQNPAVVSFVSKVAL